MAGFLDLILGKVFFPFCQPYVIDLCNCVTYFGLDKKVFFLASDLNCTEDDV